MKHLAGVKDLAGVTRLADETQPFLSEDLKMKDFKRDDGQPLSENETLIIPEIISRFRERLTEDELAASALTEFYPPEDPNEPPADVEGTRYRVLIDDMMVHEPHNGMRKLPHGTIVVSPKTEGRRMEIKWPVEGWVDLLDKDNNPTLEKYGGRRLVTLPESQPTVALATAGLTSSLLLLGSYLVYRCLRRNRPRKPLLPLYDGEEYGFPDALFDND